jgi:hypothetical protein
LRGVGEKAVVCGDTMGDGNSQGTGIAIGFLDFLRTGRTEICD